MTEIDWSKAPGWADYHATNRDAESYWYRSRPIWDTIAGAWRAVSGVYYRSDQTGLEEQ